MWSEARLNNYTCHGGVGQSVSQRIDRSDRVASGKPVAGASACWASDHLNRMQIGLTMYSIAGPVPSLDQCKHEKASLGERVAE